jgi:hypothetical protein
MSSKRNYTKYSKTWVLDEIRREIKKMLGSNENENTM